MTGKKFLFKFDSIQPSPALIPKKQEALASLTPKGQNPPRKSPAGRKDFENLGVILVRKICYLYSDSNDRSHTVTVATSSFEI